MQNSHGLPFFLLEGPEIESAFNRQLYICYMFILFCISILSSYCKILPVYSSIHLSNVSFRCNSLIYRSKLLMHEDSARSRSCTPISPHLHSGVLTHGGSPKSSTLKTFSLINHPFFWYPHVWKPPHKVW